MKALISSQPCPTWAVIIEEEDTAYPSDPSEIARSLLAVTSWSALGLDETDVEVSSDEETSDNKPHSKTNNSSPQGFSFTSVFTSFRFQFIPVSLHPTFSFTLSGTLHQHLQIPIPRSEVREVYGGVGGGVRVRPRRVLRDALAGHGPRSATTAAD